MVSLTPTSQAKAKPPGKKHQTIGCFATIGWLLAVGGIVGILAAIGRGFHFF
jgi:hypothetical protein